MSNQIKNLNPASLWQFFYELTMIPRPSKNEQMAVDYVKKFGQERDLETIVDETGNVIIKKPATKGMENRKVVLLQGHLDMVPQKNSDKVHDFENDPVETVIDGEWVRANGTTLGADNGIGVAAALAVLDSDELVHGPVEALFTIDEESGMTGAFGLKKGVLDADIMLNMDSEDEGELYVGCAGGLDANITFNCSRVGLPDGLQSLRVNVSGIKGGHSGLDIALGRANANKLLFRFVMLVLKQYGGGLVSVNGGGLRNAIPREAEAILVVPTEKANELISEGKRFEDIYRNEYSGIEPDLKLTVEKIDRNDSMIDPDTAMRLARSVLACPNGVIRMSNSMPGLVETSTNLASVVSSGNEISIKCLMRSSVDSARDELAEMLESVFSLAGADTLLDGAYPGWKPDMNSEILGVMRNVYKALYGKTPEIKAIHAGLECGIIGGVYPGLDMISFGPTIRYPHSPDEKVHIESTGKFWNFLVETLKNIPEKSG